MNQYFENNENLKSDIKRKLVSVSSVKFYIYTDNGVFNKKGLDFGSKLLLENLSEVSGDVLDIGCGTGPVGFYILSKFKDAHLDMTDVNNRALELTKKGLMLNGLKANVFYSDAYSSINKKYDFIITNPPIHAGKKKVYEIVRGAREHLKENGVLYIVSRKDQGIKSLMKDHADIYDFEIKKRKNGFYVVVATRK